MHDRPDSPGFGDESDKLRHLTGGLVKEAAALEQRVSDLEASLRKVSSLLREIACVLEEKRIVSKDSLTRRAIERALANHHRGV